MTKQMRLGWVGLFLLGSVMLQFNDANAIELEGSVNGPSVMGIYGQSFNASPGANLGFYLPPLFHPSLHNFVSAGYQSFPVKTNTTQSFRLFPMLLGFEVRGKVFDDLLTTFALGTGMSLGYLNVPGSAQNRVQPYFTVQIKPGIQWDVSELISIYARTPIQWLLGSYSMNYLTYDLGIKFKF